MSALFSRPLQSLARLSLITAAVMSLGVAASPAWAQPAEQGYVQGRILVMPRAGLPDVALAKILQANGAGRGRRLGQLGLHLVDLPPGQETQIVERLARNPHIKFAELDRRVLHDMNANDPYFGSQWHLPKIGAVNAWDGAQGSGVTIAVLDSGIDTRHPDLAGRIVAGYNFVDGNTNVEDVRGHGTQVAGSAAAALNNGVGVASVAGQLKIMPIRVSDSTGYATWSSIASGLTYAADRGARVANVSFNGAAGSASVLSAANYMKSKGGLVFVSAGNSNVDPGYANTSSVVIVSATDGNDAKASFSNFGDHVHLAAPGSSIYTTTWRQTYGAVAGTSFSAPIAAGVAGLVMSANPSLTAAQVENILFSTAVDLGAAGRDNTFGYGRINAAAAVSAALATTGTLAPSDTQAPVATVNAPLAASTVSGLTSVDVTLTDNVGVTKAELLVNGTVFATDNSAPFAFSWDTTTVANGMATVSVRAFDAAGNAGVSSSVSVNVANVVAADTQPPVAQFRNPTQGSTVAGNVPVEVIATDNSGLAGLRLSLSIDGKVVASSNGTGALKYVWNTRKVAPGSHTLSLVAVDAAGNQAAASISVVR